MTSASDHGRFVVVPAAYVFLLRESDGGPEVLLQLRQNTGYMDGHWAAAAAGHVEKGETAYDAARREAREEIGVEDLELAFVTSMQRTRSAEPIDERVDFFFTARSWTGEPRIVEPAKCAGLRWCRLDDLPDPVVPHELAVLQAVGDGGAPPYTTFGFDSGRETSMGDEKLPSQDADALGEMPDVATEPREPNPGGADALPLEDAVTAADLDPEMNPAVGPEVPEVLKEGEDTDTKATRGGDVPPEEESPA